MEQQVYMEHEAEPGEELDYEDTVASLDQDEEPNPQGPPSEVVNAFVQGWKAKRKAWVTACFQKAGSTQTKVAKQEASSGSSSMKREAAASSSGSATSSSTANLFKRRRVCLAEATR